MKSLPMIAESVRVDLNRSAAMSVEAETAIVEHLGRQYQGVGPTWCTSIPAVTTRRGRVVGNRLRAWLEPAEISVKSSPMKLSPTASRRGFRERRRQPADRLDGHRNTVFPTAPPPSGPSE